MSNHGKEPGHTTPTLDKHSSIIMSAQQEDTTMNASGFAPHNTTAQDPTNDQTESVTTAQVPDVPVTDGPQMTTVAEGDGQGTNEGHDGRHDAAIPGEDVEAVAVVKKEETDEEEDGDASVPGEGEADTGAVDAKDEEAKEEIKEEIKEEDEGDGDVAADRHQTTEWGSMLFAHAAAIDGRDPSNPITPGAFGAFAEEASEGPTAEQMEGEREMMEEEE